MCRQSAIKIDGMHCDGCAQRVQRVLEREAGVQAADVSYAAGQARVEYDEQAITTQGLTQVIERAGYTASA